MKKTLERIWFPLVVVCVIALQAVGMSPRVSPGDPGFGFVSADAPQDTIHYRNQFLRGKHRRTADDTSTFLSPIDTTPQLTARDTIFPPDSLKDIDPFRYKYYVALLDSLTHKQVRDSLRAAGDSLDWPKLDSLYYLDSAIRKKAAFDAWYNGLSKTERKKYDFEQKEKIKKHIADSIAEVKDSLKAVRDSIKENTPRILSTFAFPDSMQYKRIVQWTHDREFHQMHIQEPDTNYNYRFYDYPFLRKDVNASWLGMAGSPVQYYNWFKRSSENGVSFYDPYESWSYSAKTLPMYNSKTAYTELGYFGTLFAIQQKESDNLHILTTQNIFPELNYTLEYNRFGGGGMLENETTKNKNFSASVNYLGKKYMMHAGYIHNKVTRGENGGVSDLKMVTDTTLDAREIPIYLKDASSMVKKKTVFLDQQYRIPFTFIKKMRDRKIDKPFRDSVLASGDSLLISQLDSLLADRAYARDTADTLHRNDDVTTAFIGHSSEYSVFTRLYTDKLATTNDLGREFYHGNFFYNPGAAYDSLRVSKLENRIFLRLQPWSEEAIVSKLNGGVGNRILSFYSFDPTYLKVNPNTVWNSSFVYAGVEGQLREYIQWDAKGEYVFLGKEQNDMSIQANASLSFYPFRRARKSPVSLGVHFETSLKEPEFYHQHYFSNHFKWDNDFSKTSTTKVQARLSIPRWKISAEAGYALLANNIYFDSLGVVRQNTAPMSILSASLSKNLALGPLHLDNRILFQMSSNQDVVPLPTLAVNAKWYLQLDITKNVMQMQIGANAWYNTKYYSPGWNPAVGAFYNQKEIEYNNGPVIDAFVNVQWKRACIFVKLENAGQGWPMDKADYFSAHRFIRTQRSVKFGIYWPFYLQPSQNKQVSASGGLTSGGGSGSGMGSGGGMGGRGSSGGGGFSGGGGRSTSRNY